MSTRQLSGKEKRKLRAAGNRLKPEVWIGKEGISEGVAETIENSFQTKELVKIKLQENCSLDKNEAAQILAQMITAQVVQIIGNTILLYRPLPEQEK